MKNLEDSGVWEVGKTGNFSACPDDPGWNNKGENGCDIGIPLQEGDTEEAKPLLSCFIVWHWIWTELIHTIKYVLKNTSEEVLCWTYPIHFTQKPFINYICWKGV